MDKTQLFTSYFLLRLLINTVSMIILVRFVYYNTYKKKDSFFTFFLLNLIVFLLAFMLERTGAFSSIGSAFGLLAAFSLLRFRTETISMKDMTYLFIIMTFGLLNSVMKGTYLEIITINAMIIAVVYVVDGNQLMRNQRFKTIEYPSLENIRPDKQAQLISDLRDRTGLDIQKITIEHIDFGKERAIIKIYYY
ncbi:MAG: DUF4956 domain-containing protein [Bacteroidia bacterium]|nr:DUF4956 domain-containing protein [Bacteroidia bacterium]